MNNAQLLLDPTSEQTPVQRQPLPRPTALEDLTIGLLDISKARGDVFLDHLEGRLGTLGMTTRRYKKPTYTRVAPTELQQRIATECDLLLEALAD